MVRILAYLASIALGLGLALRALVRYTNDPDSPNSSAGLKFKAHDSTVGAYARRSQEIARELDEMSSADLKENVEPRPTEPKQDHPETRTGA